MQPDDAARRRRRCCCATRRSRTACGLRPGGWQDELQLGPGEERRVEVPLDVRRGATLVTSTTSAGFRPSAVEPKSRDDRFLGVWVKLE